MWGDWSVAFLENSLVGRAVGLLKREKEGEKKVLGGRSRVVITRVQVESREVPRECEHRFFSL